MKNILTKIFITSFFGYNNWKFFLIQLIYCFSNKPSLFSLKRIERFFMYSTAMFFEWKYFELHKADMTVPDFLSLVIPLFTMAGLSMMATQQEAKNTIPPINQ